MSADAPSAIEIQQLAKDYRAPDGSVTPVLRIAELHLPLNNEMAIRGKSGSGKTTLLNILAGLLLPTSGQVRVLGQDMAVLSEAARDRFRAHTIGFVFQTPHLLAGFSAIENILLAMRAASKVPKQQQAHHAQLLLERVGLADRMNHKPAQLSSGQQQRVAVARAIANRPRLILADEPTAHVDDANGQRVMSLLRSYCAEQGAALLLASHDRDVLATFACVHSLENNP